MNSIFVVFWVFYIFRFAINHWQTIRIFVFQSHSLELSILIDHNCFKASTFKGSHGVFHTIDYQMSIHWNVFKEFGKYLFFALEFLPFHAVWSELNCLIQPILSSIRSINDFNNLWKEPLIEFIVFHHACLEVSTSSQHQSTNIHFIICDKNLCRNFAYLYFRDKH